MFDPPPAKLHIPVPLSGLGLAVPTRPNGELPIGGPNVAVCNLADDIDADLTWLCAGWLYVAPCMPIPIVGGSSLMGLSRRVALGPTIGVE
jgi:hypothetical protein